MEQPPLFFENVYAALNYVLQHVGKPKDVGPRIFPHKEDPLAAGRLLSDCLNENRDARFDPETLILFLRLARDAGCHVGIEYLCTAAGYSKPTPVLLEDEEAELKRDLIASVAKLERIASQLNLKMATGRP